MVVTSKLRRHKVMERAMRALMGNNLPPRFKFKDTYDSIEVPTAYQQHLPSQATLEAKFDELIAEEEVVAPTTEIKADMIVSSNLEVGTSNLFVDTETGNVGIGTDSPAYTLDVHGTSNVGALTATTVTASAFSGNASTATKLATARAINGVNFDGSTAITITANTPQTLTRGSYLTGSNFNGGTATTWAVDATEAGTASKIVVRNSSGDIICRLVRPTYSNQTTISGAMAYRVNNGSDNYIRFCSDKGAIRTFLDAPTRTGGNASGTWGINITGDADTVDSLHASSFLRSDASDTVDAGVTYSWAATNTHGLSFKNSAYNTYLYIGGWTNSNDNNISRIRNSSGNLHIDSAANGNLYLNWYTDGSVQVGSSMTVTGTVTASAFSGNASTATKLATARAINGVNFDGSAAITVNGTNYNVNNSWLREQGDNAHFRQYGNTRQMVFRTDGTTEYASGVGGYPFVWMYGGDAASNRRMFLNTSGQLWCSNYGWLHDKFMARTQVFSDTNANAGFDGQTIDYNASGSQTTTTDRVHRALFIDVDSTATGGDTNHEHRLYGIYNDVRHSGDSDLVYGMYCYTRSDHTSGTTTNLRAGDFLALASGTGTNTNIYGLNSYALKDGGSTGTTANMFGVRGEVEVDAGTCTNAYAFQSHIDRDGGTITNGYLYYGSYSGTVGTKWGVYVTGETKNYFSGNVGIGTSGPTERLQVQNGNILMTGTWQPGGYFRLMGYNTAKQIQFNYNDGTWISDNNKILFGVGGSQDSKGIYDERMRITNTGVRVNNELLVTTTNGNSATGYGVSMKTNANQRWTWAPGTDNWLRLYGDGQSGNDYAGYKAVAVGNFWSAGATRFSSDDRVKHFEEEIPECLELIKQLKPYKYKKTSKIYTENYTGEIGEEGKDWDWEIGLIAQDIKKIPYLEFSVTNPDTTPEGKYGLNYTIFIGVCIQGIKDLSNKLSETRTELQSTRIELQTTQTQLETTRTDLTETQTQIDETRTQLEQALEAEKVKTKNLESRIAFLETAVASLIS